MFHTICSYAIGTAITASTILFAIIIVSICIFVGLSILKSLKEYIQDIFKKE